MQEAPASHDEFEYLETIAFAGLVKIQLRICKRLEMLDVQTKVCFSSLNKSLLSPLLLLLQIRPIRVFSVVNLFPTGKAKFGNLDANQGNTKRRY